MKQEKNWQLFLDNYMLARSTGFDRVIHHPDKKGVVIPTDKPWETAGAYPQYIGRREDGSFFAIYTAIWWDIDRATSIASENFRNDRPHQMYSSNAYATSEDGIHWEKPILGLIDAPADIDWEKHAPFPSPKGTSKNNNLGVPFSVVADLGTYGNVTDPNKRFVLKVLPDLTGATDIGSHEGVSPKTYWARELPDFLNDPKWREKLIPFDGTLSTRGAKVNYWDDIHEEWVAIQQNVWYTWLPSRQIARFSTKDFINWKSMNVMYPDAEDAHDLEHYEEPMELTPYYAEGVVIGMLSWFHSDRTHPFGGPTLTPGPEHANVWPWCRKGTNEIRITISRDGGKTWDRTVSRKAWIPHGTEPDADDRCVMWSPPPIRVGDEDWFYMISMNQDHLFTLNNKEQTSYHHSGPRVCQAILYTQKHNRFVSMRARNYAETLITNPVKVDGDTLQLNVDANRGVIKVGIALADPVPTFEGKVPSIAPHLKHDYFIPGFGFDDCEPILANSIEHTVKFKGGASLESIKGKEVYLLFQMADSELYGFRFV